MSKSVIIGGIGKNPAIDKISKIDAISAKEHAAKRMERLLKIDDTAIAYEGNIKTRLDQTKYREVPIHFNTKD